MVRENGPWPAVEGSFDGRPKGKGWVLVENVTRKLLLVRIFRLSHGGSGDG